VIILEQADFDEHFFIKKKYSLPQLPPSHLDSLLEPFPPVVPLPETLVKDSDEPSHSQQPVHGRDGSMSSKLPTALSETPASYSFFQTAPISSPSISPSLSPSPSIEAPGPCPQCQCCLREQWLSEQWTVSHHYKEIREPTSAVLSSDKDEDSDDPLDMLYAHSASAPEPTSYKQSQLHSNRDLWHKACKKEMKAHRLNGT
jgi:hypothetical protein